MKAEHRIYELFAEANPAPLESVSAIDRPAPDAFLHDLRRSTVLTPETQIREELPGRSPSPRWRGPAVAVATFAVVAAVLGAAIWFAAPGDDTPVATEPATTTVPETATTIPETATTVVTPVEVTVPDLDGLTVAEARDLAASIGFELVVVEGDVDSAIVVAQEPSPGAVMLEGSEVLVDAAVTPTCVVPLRNAPGIGQTTITVLFECGDDRSLPSAGVAVQRIVPEQFGEALDRIEWTLRSLLAGPTTEESIAGFESAFSSATADALNSVTLDQGRVVVDFDESIYVNNASTSTGSMFFNAELHRNVFQHPEVDSVEFRVNGDCEAWSAFFQSDGCWVITRADWEAQLTAWDAER